MVFLTKASRKVRLGAAGSFDVFILCFQLNNCTWEDNLTCLICHQNVGVLFTTVIEVFAQGDCMGR